MSVKKSIIIDGTRYDGVIIAELKRRADILDKYAYRSEDGILHREVIGTYHNYDLRVGVENPYRDRQLYNTLFDVLSEPTAYHEVILPHDEIQFRAYFSSVQDSVRLIDENGAIYTGLSCKCTAMEPRRRPTKNAEV